MADLDQNANSGPGNNTPPAPAPAPAPEPAAVQPATPPTGGASSGIDISKILLPKKETPGQTVDSAQRVSAGELMAAEQQAAKEGIAPEAPKAEAPAAVPPIVKEEESNVRPLQTYKSDIESLVKQGGVSEVSIAAAEAVRKDNDAKKEEAPVPAPADPRRFKMWIYSGVGAVLVLGSLGLIFAVILRPTTTPVTTGAHTAIISVDDATLVEVAPPRKAIMDTLTAARDSSALSLGLVARLYVTQSAAAKMPAPYPIQDLLSVLAPEIPTDLLRTLESEYLLGVHSYDRNQTFLILRTDSYDVAYRGMLGWERTMAHDLSPLFERKLPVKIDETPAAPVTPIGTSTATTTATSTSPAPKPDVVVPTQFVDRIVENRDVRALVNQENELLLLWTFIDRRTILITTNDATLREVVTRMAQAPIQYQPQ